MAMAVALARQDRMPLTTTMTPGSNPKRQRQGEQRRWPYDRQSTEGRGGLIDVDANRYALRQSDPIESGINIRKQTAARCTLTIFDPGRDAFNVTKEAAVVAHEFDGNAVVNVNICELGFLEIAVNMQRGGSNNAERRTARCEIVARS